MSDQPGYYGAPQEQPRHGSGMAIAALVLGLLALVTSITVVGGVVLGLIAVVLGIVASGRARRGAATGRGLAITGIVLGVLGILVSVAVVAIGVSIFNSDSGQQLRDCVANAGSDQAKIKQCQQDFQDSVGG